MARSKKGGGDHGGGGGHDGSGGLRWLLTYADMITLLMAFFIMMYAISALDLKKFNALASTLNQIFGDGTRSQKPALEGGQGLLDQGSRGPRMVIVPQSDSPTDLQEVEEGIEHFVEKNQLSGKVMTWREERGLVVSLLTDGVLFERGSAARTPALEQALLGLTSTMRRKSALIRVEGHTCDLPISTARFPSNWELSAGRAATVARYMIQYCEIAAARLSTAGYADQRPLFPNTDEAQRRLNRRVDIVLLANSEARREPRRRREPDLTALVAPVLDRQPYGGGEAPASTADAAITFREPRPRPPGVPVVQGPPPAATVPGGTR